MSKYCRGGKTARKNLCLFIQFFRNWRCIRFGLGQARSRVGLVYSFIAEICSAHMRFARLTYSRNLHIYSANKHVFKIETSRPLFRNFHSLTRARQNTTTNADSQPLFPKTNFLFGITKHGQLQIYRVRKRTFAYHQREHTKISILKPAEEHQMGSGGVSYFFL